VTYHGRHFGFVISNHCCFTREQVQQELHVESFQQGWRLYSPLPLTTFNPNGFPTLITRIPVVATDVGRDRDFRKKQNIRAALHLIRSEEIIERFIIRLSLDIKSIGWGSERARITEVVDYFIPISDLVSDFSFGPPPPLYGDQTHHPSRSIFRKQGISNTNKASTTTNWIGSECGKRPN
jgi:hypothetical protein